MASGDFVAQLQLFATMVATTLYGEPNESGVFSGPVVYTYSPDALPSEYVNNKSTTSTTSTSTSTSEEKITTETFIDLFRIPAIHTTNFGKNDDWLLGTERRFGSRTDYILVCRDDEIKIIATTFERTGDFEAVVCKGTFEEICNFIKSLIKRGIVSV